MEDQSLEGRVLAHRQILLLILQEMAGTQASDRIRSILQERLTLRDGQEDPGVIDAPGLSVELALADEFRLIVEAMPEGGDDGASN